MSASVRVVTALLNGHKVSTRAILESFVSSTKFDVFKCQSTDVNSFLTLPYACSYTKGAFFPRFSSFHPSSEMHSGKRRWGASPGCGNRTRISPHCEYVKTGRLGPRYLSANIFRIILAHSILQNHHESLCNLTITEYLISSGI